jgi:hypothetical protein
MKHKTLLISFIVLSTILAIFFLWLNEDSTQPNNQNHAVKTTVTKKTRPQQPLEQTTLTATSSPALPKELNEQIKSISAAYAQTVNYPVYSQPISHALDVREPLPFEETAVSIPFPTTSGNVIYLHAATDDYQYFTGDTILFEAAIKNAPPSAVIEAEAVLGYLQGEDIRKIALTPAQADYSAFSARIDTTSLQTRPDNPELLISLSIVVDNEPLFTTVGFIYTVPSAEVTGLGEVAVNRENLDIPIEIEVFDSGYYFISAVLEDTKSQIPLIKLQSEGRLTEGADILTLHAHFQALKAKQSEGPYTLKNITLHRGAEYGEQFDLPGKVSQPSFKIPQFSFDTYEDIPYHNEFADERIQFLRSLTR